MSVAPALPPPPEEQRWLGLPRPWVEAGVYAVGAVAVAAVGFSGLWDVFEIVEPHPGPWWGLATALPACALVVTKYAAPRLSLVVALALFAVDLLTVGGILPFLVVLDVLHVTVVRADARVRRRILFAGVGIVMTAAVIAYARSGEPRAMLMIALQWCGLGGMVYWYATAWQQSRELFALHARAAEDAAALARRDRVEVIRAEREGMARELHDLVAGHVSAVAIRSEAALASTDPDVHRPALSAVRDASLDAHEALREMIAVLRRGDDSGGGDDLSAPRRATVPELADAARRAGLRVTVSDRVAGDVPTAVDRAIGRIVQEALANAARHAAGAEVVVDVSADRAQVRVDVVSRDGRGDIPSALAGNGWGLELIRERVRALGGELTAGPEGGAWAVRAVLPREVAR